LGRIEVNPFFSPLAYKPVTLLRNPFMFKHKDGHYRIIVVSPEFLLSLLTPNSKRGSTWVEGLPDGFEPEAVQFDFMKQAFDVLIHHPSFEPEVKPGELIPEITVVYHQHEATGGHCMACLRGKEVVQKQGERGQSVAGGWLCERCIRDIYVCLTGVYQVSCSNPLKNECALCHRDVVTVGLSKSSPSRGGAVVHNYRLCDQCIMEASDKLAKKVLGKYGYGPSNGMTREEERALVSDTILGSSCIMEASGKLAKKGVSLKERLKAQSKAEGEVHVHPSQDEMAIEQEDTEEEETAQSSPYATECGFNHWQQPGTDHCFCGRITGLEIEKGAITPSEERAPFKEAAEIEANTPIRIGNPFANKPGVRDW
jgi:hypothetical protein